MTNELISGRLVGLYSSIRYWGLPKVEVLTLGGGRANIGVCMNRGRLARIMNYV
jgi:hypothetical protein